MTTPTEICEQLRNPTMEERYDGMVLNSSVTVYTMKQAADIITAQAAEIERLKARAEAALEKMQEAAAIALPILERDRQSLLECCSKLIIEPDGKISVVPDTLDPDAAEDIAAYDDAISRLRDALTTQGGGE